MAKKSVSSFSEVQSLIEDFLPNPQKVLSDIQTTLYDEGTSIIKGVKSKHDWKDKTGALTNSHGVKKRGKLEVVLFASAAWAKHLYYGTKRHRAWRGIMVSGVWAGQERKGRASGTRSTPKNAKELLWLEKAWSKRRAKTVKKVLITLKDSFKL